MARNFAELMEPHPASTRQVGQRRERNRGRQASSGRRDTYFGQVYGGRTSRGKDWDDVCLYELNEKNAKDK